MQGELASSVPLPRIPVLRLSGCNRVHRSGMQFGLEIGSRLRDTLDNAWWTPTPCGDTWMPNDTRSTQLQVSRRTEQSRRWGWRSAPLS